MAPTKSLPGNGETTTAGHGADTEPFVASTGKPRNPSLNREKKNGKKSSSFKGNNADLAIPRTRPPKGARVWEKNCRRGSDEENQTFSQTPTHPSTRGGQKRPFSLIPYPPHQGEGKVDGGQKNVQSKSRRNTKVPIHKGKKTGNF